MPTNENTNIMPAANKKKCISCPRFWCKTYLRKTNSVEGYCAQLRQKVNGEDSCKVFEQLRLF